MQKVTVRDVASVIETLAPLAYQEPIMQDLLLAMPICPLRAYLLR